MWPAVLIICLIGLAALAFGVLAWLLGRIENHTRATVDELKIHRQTAESMMKDAKKPEGK